MNQDKFYMQKALDEAGLAFLAKMKSQSAR